MAPKPTNAPKSSAARSTRDDQDQAEEFLLCTKHVARMTGLSASYFEKGRTYGYGPAYVRFGRAIRYRPTDVQKWMEANHHEIGGAA